MMGNEAASGFDKSVIFVDARDLENSDDLPARGAAKLKEHERVISFGAEVLSTGPFEYEAGGFRLNVVFGDSPLTLGQKIKREIKSI